MNLATLTFENIELVNRDFSGVKAQERLRKRGYVNTSVYPSFSIEIDDPELQQRLSDNGIVLWSPNATPEHLFMNVRVDNRYGNVEICEVFPDGKANIKPEREWGDIDNLWLSSATCTVGIIRYNSPKGETTAAVLRSMIIYIMGDDERREAQAQRDQENDPTARMISQLIGR